LKDRFSNINTAKGQIEKQREFDAARARLQTEFEAIDKNKDGMVSLDELQDFLNAKVPLNICLICFIGKRGGWL
jgi:Ca2+-binding EF-hand superfamily protein